MKNVSATLAPSTSSRNVQIHEAASATPRGRIAVAGVLLVIAALLLPSAPASALELPEPSARSGSAALSVGDARAAVDTLLSKYLGPAVTSSGRPLEWAVRDCRVGGDRGTCRGWVVGGMVECRGLFRVRKQGRAFFVFPLRVVCAADR